MTHHTPALADILQHVYGSTPEEAVQAFAYHERRLPAAAKHDFLSLVALELLVERREKLPPGEWFLPYEPGDFRRVLDRVTKRIRRALIRLAAQRTIEREPEDRRSAAIDTERRADLKAALKTLQREDLRLLRLRLEGQSLKDIAAKLGTSTTQVHRRMAAIIAALRKSLDAGAG